MAMAGDDADGRRRWRWPATVTCSPAPRRPAARPDPSRSSALSSGERREELADLGGGGYASGQHDLLVDDETGGGHHAVADDGGEVGHLHDLRLDAEGGDRLTGDALEVDAVGAAGAEDLDDHGGISLQWWCQDGMTALNR